MHFPVSASTRVSVSVMISSAHLPSVLWNIHRTGIYSLSMYLSLSLRGIFLTGHVRSDRIQRYFSLLSSESCQALSHAAPNSRSCNVRPCGVAWFSSQLTRRTGAAGTALALPALSKGSADPLLLKLHLKGTSQRYTEHDRCARRVRQRRSGRLMDISDTPAAVEYREEKERDRAAAERAP